MKIGDVAAPGALLRTPAPTGGASFLRTFGSVQRDYRERRPVPLHAVPERLERRSELESRARRFDDAARSLSGVTPRTEFATKRESVVGDVESRATTREITTQTELVTKATAARQASIAVADPDAKIARKDSQLKLRLDRKDPKIEVRVGKQGASLNELAQLINDDADNQGGVMARVEADAGGSRLVIETTQTGSDAVLDVRQDDFRSPEGDKFRLIDRALAERGRDESSEIVENTEIVTGRRRTVSLREIETRHQLEDEAFAARVAEFAESYTALKTFTEADNLDLGDDFGLLGNDDRVRDVLRVLGELASGLAERSSESGTTLADIGISVDGAGGLRLDADALQQAIARDTSSVVELLNASESGLAAAATAALAPAEPETASPTAGLQGFLGSLSTEQGRLEARAGLLEGVVSALSQGPTNPGPQTPAS
jgi:flagellar capping protein FliD